MQVSHASEADGNLKLSLSLTGYPTPLFSSPLARLHQPALETKLATMQRVVDRNTPRPRKSRAKEATSANRPFTAKQQNSVEQNDMPDPANFLTQHMDEEVEQTLVSRGLPHVRFNSYASSQSVSTGTTRMITQLSNFIKLSKIGQGFIVVITPQKHMRRLLVLGGSDV